MIQISPEMRASVDSIKAELRDGVRVVTRERQTGKTLALMEHIHETAGGDVRLVTFNMDMADYFVRRYRAMSPEDKLPKAIAIGFVDGSKVEGTDQAWATDEVWPEAVTRKAWCYMALPFLGGVGTPMCMDMHSN